jgi:hypothetical protein
MEHVIEDLGVFGKSISRSLENALLDLQRCSAAAQPLHGDRTLKKTMPPHWIRFRLAMGPGDVMSLEDSCEAVDMG